MMSKSKTTIAAATLGKLGGSANTTTQRAARSAVARANGKAGGRLPSILTHHNPTCDPPWMAVSVAQAEKLVGPLTAAERRDLGELMASYCRLLEEGGLVHYGTTRREAVAKIDPEHRLARLRTQRHQLPTDDLPLFKSPGHHKYPCTDCAGDANIAFSDVQGPEGVIVGKDERLCLKCCKLRGVPTFLHSPKCSGSPTTPNP